MNRQKEIAKNRKDKGIDKKIEKDKFIDRKRKEKIVRADPSLVSDQ